MLTKNMLRQYVACCRYPSAGRNPAIIRQVDRFLHYAEKHDPTMYAAAQDKFIVGQSWRTVAAKLGRGEEALRKAFDRFLDEYNKMHK